MPNPVLPNLPPARPAHRPHRLAALWPQAPLALILAAVGALNLVEGLQLPLTALQRIRALHGLADSLSVLGGTAQVILGVMLALAGIGLLWRLVSAWTLSVLLLVTGVGVTIAQWRWGVTLALQCVLLGALLWAKPYFVRRTVLASILFSLTGVLAVLVYGTFGSYLLREGFRPVITDLTTAFYFTVVTLSTVGYGDIVPVSTEARWFVVSLLVVGLGVFASAIASALGPKISGEFQRLFNPKSKPMEPKHHVILVGEGPIAANTAAELALRHRAFVQVVQLRTGREAADHALIEGDATSEAVLRQAGIGDADLVIAAREDDGENALIALVAKDLNPHVRLLAVASSAASIRRLKLAHADLVFSPAAVGSRMLADLVEGNPIAPAFHDLLEGSPPNA